MWTSLISLLRCVLHTLEDDQTHRHNKCLIQIFLISTASDLKMLNPSKKEGERTDAAMESSNHGNRCWVSEAVRGQRTLPPWRECVGVCVCRCATFVCSDERFCQQAGNQTSISTTHTHIRKHTYTHLWIEVYFGCHGNRFSSANNTTGYNNCPLSTSPAHLFLPNQEG